MPNRLGYRRFWLAEHHGMPGIASAATAVLIGHVAGGTQTHPRRAPAASCCPTTRRW
jgi:alkanesulfonate monooxygenase SsuD/methylene tetrahydromethanopterin reductase-like flavin-dependent oxidoreductase (luciferase family)